MLSFTFFDNAEWTTDSVSKELYSKLEKENKVLKARLKDAIGIEYTDSTDYISQLSKNVLNQRKELRNLNKALERECKRNKELEELYSGAQRDVSMLNLKVMELNQGIRDSSDLTWKEKYDELKKKIRSLEDNEMYTTCLKDRCGKAEHTIDTIKEALIDGNYIHHIDLRRNEK